MKPKYGIRTLETKIRIRHPKSKLLILEKDERIPARLSRFRIFDHCSDHGPVLLAWGMDQHTLTILPNIPRQGLDCKVNGIPCILRSYNFEMYVFDLIRR